jgi:glycogen synthase
VSAQGTLVIFVSHPSHVFSKQAETLILSLCLSPFLSPSLLFSLSLCLSLSLFSLSLPFSLSTSKKNFQGGLVYSNAVTTVSPSYASEALGGGAAGWLRGTLARPDVAAKFSGVLNGIDEDLWDPATDPSLPVNYDARTLREGKKICKEFVQRGLGLDVDPSIPLVICVTRLVPQKGVHLIKRALIHTCRDLGGQFVLLGTGHADGDFKVRGGEISLFLPLFRARNEKERKSWRQERPEIAEKTQN